jgi:hypothetical protein
MRRVQANPLPTAVESQTSFGIFGIALGQTMRVSVANTLTPTDVTFRLTLAGCLLISGI